MDTKIIRSIFITLAYLSAFSVGYWLILFFINTENDLRHEYLMGAVIFAIFTGPLWLGTAIIALVKIKTLKKQLVVLSVIPSIFILLTLVGIYL